MRYNGWVKYVIEGEFCDLNTYIDAERGHFRSAAAIKKQETDRAAWSVVGKGKVTEYPVIVTFTWYVKDHRKDADNIDFARKFILDGMVLARVLANDSRKHVAGFGPCRVLVDKDRPRVEVTVERAN